MSNRLWFPNIVLESTTLITASSEQSSNPASHLKDQQRQKTLRSKVGWTVTEDNRRIDVFRTGPGTYVVTIALGYYATGAELAEAIRVAFEAADAPILWGVDYDVAAANKFRIRDAGGAPLNFDLLWQSGANAYRSAGKDLGFNTAADDTGASTYTADSVAYQSRMFVRFNDTDLSNTAQAFAYLEHNIPSVLLGQCTITIEGNATDVWSAPTFTQTITLINLDPAYVYFGSQSHAWWRVTVACVQDPVAFNEVGIIYLGPTNEPQYCIADDLSMQSQPFTTSQDGLSGSRFSNIQPERMRWSIGWKALDPIARATVDAFFREVVVGEAFFFDFDTATSGELVYVIREAFSWAFVPYQYRDYATDLVEAI